MGELIAAEDSVSSAVALTGAPSIGTVFDVIRSLDLVTAAALSFHLADEASWVAAMESCRVRADALGRGEDLAMLEATVIRELDASATRIVEQTPGVIGIVRDRPLIAAASLVLLGAAVAIFLGPWGCNEASEALLSPLRSPFVVSISHALRLPSS